MNRFLFLAPLLTALLLASGPTSAQQLNVNPYSTSAAPRGPADQDLNFGAITNTICFHHVQPGTSNPDASVRCGTNNWPPEPACRDARLREHGVPTLVGTTYFDRPHQVVVHIAFDTACAGGGGATSSITPGQHGVDGEDGGYGGDCGGPFDAPCPQPPPPDVGGGNADNDGFDSAIDGSGPDTFGLY